MRRSLGLCATLIAATLQAQVRISEIHYHPASEDPREEFVELHNAGLEPVPLAGWRLSEGVSFTFPAATLAPGAYLAVAADPAVFQSIHPGVTNVVGGWTGTLSNNRETLALDDAAGTRIDAVPYADEGDWAVRRLGPVDRGVRGWTWFALHDGGGHSLERLRSDLPSDQGQNWASSEAPHGTPGRARAATPPDLAPLIVQIAHWPALPRSVDAVSITARLVNDLPTTNTATLHWRLDGDDGAFRSTEMLDDGLHGDGAARDGLFGAFVPAQAHRAIVEFHLTASDAAGNLRTWPAPALDEAGADLGPVANALYLVSDTADPGTVPPIYRLILKEADRLALAAIGTPGSPSRNSNAQFNGTFLSVDGTGTEVRYTAGFRNRGHGSRDRLPNNYRVNFPSDHPWKGVRALNLNGQYTHAQILGSVLALQAGVAGADSRAVRVNLNSVDPGNNGPQTYGGIYAANEVINGDWADHWFPDDSNGNAYRALRDLAPSGFNYRGPDDPAYTNTWFKQTNPSENDWTDLKAMLRVIGTNDLFTPEAARSVIHLEQWLDYFAFMALVDNRETSPNTGHNDDYFLYAGRDDPRFRLMYYDLDSILNQGDVRGSTTAGVFGATAMPAFERLLRSPEIEPLYYASLRRLLATTFAKDRFDATVDQTLVGFVPPAVLDGMKAFMDGRRNHVAALVAAQPALASEAPRAVIQGEPRARTPLRTATLRVGTNGVAAYRFRLNDGPFGEIQPAAQPIVLADLPEGSLHTVHVIALGTNGVWQAEALATASRSWTVDPAWPAVRIDEVLARNVAAFPHSGTYPDAIELFNEGADPVDLSGMGLTDHAGSPGKFRFPAGTTLAAGARLVLLANNADGSPGLHTGFSLAQDGEGVHLFDRADRGGALLDSVTFGPQLPDTTFSRVDGGEFVLSWPTLGAANVARPQGDPRGLKINEWLASASSLGASDQLELFNPSPAPVDLGGLFLTDNPIGEPTRHRLAPLSFIAGGGHRLFLADGKPSQGPSHLGFKLSADQGLIALLDSALELIDLVSYGPQQTDVSTGRLPDGGVKIAPLPQATLGGPNPTALPNCTVATQTLALLEFPSPWRYQQTNDLTGQPWFAPHFDDTAWPSGPGLLAFESASALAPLIGTELGDPRVPPVGLSSGHAYYFRTSFVFPHAPDGYRFEAAARIDDGAVLYVNGVEAKRIRVGGTPGTTVENTLSANASPPGNDALSNDSFILPASFFVQGTNVLAVSVHQDAPTSSDIVWGLALTASLTTTNCAPPGLVLNEVLAANRTGTNAEGRAPDWVELHNGTGAAIDLAGHSLTDDLTVPQRWTFAPGTVVPANGFFVVECDDQRPASATNTGFALSAAGDRLYLLAPADQGGATVDSLVFGLQVPDFSLARSPASPATWTLALPTPGGPNLAAALAPDDGLRINEWMAAPSEGDDWLELHNPAGQPVSLAGLSLSDDPTRRGLSTFPALSFIGAGSEAQVPLWADDNPGAGADHLAFKLSSNGEFVGLYHPSGRAIDGVGFGPQTGDVSEGRFPDGTADIAAFPGTASPGAPNHRPFPGLVVNEVLSHTDPPLEDAVEILNLGADPVDLGGWFLSNSGKNPRKFRVPVGTVVPPGGFHVFYEAEFGGAASADLAEPFTFNSAHGDEVHLSAIDPAGQLTGYRASARFGAAANGGSHGRFVTSAGEEFVALSRRTFGVDAPGSVAAFRSGTGASNAYPQVGPVVVSEIHFQPTNVFGAESQAGAFIELENTTGQAVPLFDPDHPSHTWRIEGGIGFSLPIGLVLPAGGRLLVVDFDPVAEPERWAWFRTAFGVPTETPVLGPFLGTLARQGEDLRLLRPDAPQTAPHPDAGFVPWLLVEHVHYRATAPWPTNGLVAGASWQRRDPAGFANEPAHWSAAPPTAGRDNNPDTDRDGLPDHWELAHGLDPSSALERDGATGDADRDGVDNLAEFRAGTAPDDADDYLKVEFDPSFPEGTALRFVAPGGRRTSVLYSDFSPLGPWFKLAEAPFSANTANVTVHDSAPSPAQRFYRLAVGPAFIP